MNANIAALLYLPRFPARFSFLALRGLAKSPKTAQVGNRRGMIGMGLAIITTLAVTGGQRCFEHGSWSLAVWGSAVRLAP